MELFKPCGTTLPSERLRAASDRKTKVPLRSERHGEIAVIYDDGRLFGPSNWRDLENVTLHFEPDMENGPGYHYERGELEWREPSGDPISYEPGWPFRSVEVDLPFEFQFGGESWRRVVLNSTGSITFDYREDKISRPRFFQFSE